MEILLGVIGALVGAFFFQRNKAKTAEARNENLKVKEKIQNMNKDVVRNEGHLLSEQDKRNNLIKENEDAKAVKDTIDTLSSFFNKR